MDALAGTVLFGYRLLGAVLFEVTGTRVTLHLREPFRKLVAVLRAVARFWPRLEPNSFRFTAIPLVLLLVPKMAQEDLLHFAEAKPWNWRKEHLLRIE